MPSRSSTISVNALPGQPRPGSMASSAGKPDGSAAGSGAQSPPRQMAGLDSTAASAGFMAGVMRTAHVFSESLG